MALPFLQTFGLTENEANLYELLLQLGEVPASSIIKEAKLKRPTVYKTLYTLEAKGLVTKKDIAKKIHFSPAPPTSLMALAESQYSVLDRAKKDLQEILPQLASAYTLSVEKPVVTTYEGVEGLKKIYEDTLVEKKPIYALVQTNEVDPKLEKWLIGHYAKQRAKLGITAQVILASGGWSQEYAKRNDKEARTTVVVSREKFPFEHEVDIYGNKVAFINFKKGEPLIGLIIDHPLIAKTAKAWFDLAWEGAQHANEEVKPQA